MKPRIRTHYINLHTRTMKLLENQAHKQVLQCYRLQKKRVIQYVLSGYSLDELLDHLPKFYKDSIKPLWASTLKQIWNNAAEEADSNTREWLAPNALGTIKKAWEDSVDSWMQEHAGARIEGITDTDQEWLANTLRSGESEGKSTEEMASDLTDTFDNMSEGRAGTISRTETAGAYNYAGLDTAKDLMPDGSTKTWLTTSPNPRPSHQDVDGTTVGMDETFELEGGDLDYPGDPAGPIEETVNCMCVLEYSYPSGSEEAPEESEGGE